MTLGEKLVSLLPPAHEAALMLGAVLHVQVMRAHNVADQVERVFAWTGGLEVVDLTDELAGELTEAFEAAAATHGWRLRGGRWHR
jgi:hypothetical protein